MQCIPIFGMLGVSRETTPFWYEIHTFVLTVCIYLFILYKGKVSTKGYK